LHDVSGLRLAVEPTGQFGCHDPVDGGVVRSIPQLIPPSAETA
jgi:hypothetical protein